MLSLPALKSAVLQGALVSLSVKWLLEAKILVVDVVSDMGTLLLPSPLVNRGTRAYIHTHLHLFLFL